MDFLHFGRYDARMDRKGYVFLCSDITEIECLEQNLFGGMEKYQARVKGLEKGDALFLYNYNSKKLIGIFQAESELKKDIVPGAWNGVFPWQVLVRRLETPKPITREDIGTILKFDRAGRPTSRLTSQMVDALIDLFRSEKRIVQYDDGNRYVCKDGHHVKSHPEQKICDWLFEHRIPHAYEYPIPEAKRCDFFVPDDNGGTYIEYWGLKDEEYLRNKEHKLAIYRQHDLNLLSIEAEDAKRLDEILAEKFSRL